ncbi:MAG: hypothetical protein IPH37_13365 [Burkholderiales bacterium]|nr:hypothetical protein [Burkholderiales bacterium]
MHLQIVHDGLTTPGAVHHHIIDQQDQCVEAPATGFGAAHEVEKIRPEIAGAFLDDVGDADIPPAASVPCLDTAHNAGVQVFLANGAAVDNPLEDVGIGQYQRVGLLDGVDSQARQRRHVTLHGHQGLHCLAGVIKMLECG